METQTKKQIFNFYKDEKVTMWQRARFEIEAETYEQAVEMIKEMEQNPRKYNEIEIYWDDLTETIETLTIEENKFEPTIEIFSGVTNEVIYNNAPRLPKP